VDKIKQTYVLPFLEECHFIIISFDLWMFKGVRDIFALVMIFLGANLKSKHVILGFFEAIEIIR
jgi:hypothetical protein